ncbi:MAG: hypothetical protein KA206_00810 [Paludibacter sp.]|nr:hypothetical protein [Paludibacter sp.]
MFTLNDIMAQKPIVKVYYTTFDSIKNDGRVLINEYPQIAEANIIKEKILIYPHLKFQTIKGIGGCFNEIGADVFNQLPVSKKEEIMMRLFDKNVGAGFSFCRTAVGASDFGLSAYSYSEQKDDYLMKNFSIQRDEKCLIPYIKAAYRINPKILLFASPWSPPAWLKQNASMTGPAANNKLIDKPEIYKTYALYLSKYIQAYYRNGITINRLCVQNETDANVSYPSCEMSPQQMCHFILSYLKPQFVNFNLKTEIWAGTYRVAEGELKYAGKFEAIELFASKKLRKSVSGVSMQYTRPQYIHDFKALYPNVKIMHSESNCFNGENSIEQAKTRFKEVSDYITSGSENFAYWNMILNESGKSGWNWKQNSLLNIDKQSSKIVFNPDYTVIAFLSRYLQPGCKRIAHYTSVNQPCIAIDNGNESYTVLIENLTNNVRTCVLQVANLPDVEVKLPSNALISILINI